ncbi:prepilin peptidase [Terrabacter sp. BE26]|uniref:prepilin peptidase n=1 Tax=Terrabacter sp. BE26 TaxID=2898152 RepID=UPI0035BE4867
MPITYLACSWVLIALAAIDLDVHRLPDAIQLPGYPVLLVLLACCSILTGDLDALLRASLAGAGMFGLFFVLLLAAPNGGMGFGDVKLSGLLGLLLGWLSWRHATVATLGTFVLGGFVAAVLLVSGRSDRRGEFAYGPVMVASALMTIILLPLAAEAA